MIDRTIAALISLLLLIISFMIFNVIYGLLIDVFSATDSMISEISVETGSGHIPKEPPQAISRSIQMLGYAISLTFAIGALLVVIAYYMWIKSR